MDSVGRGSRLMLVQGIVGKSGKPTLDLECGCAYYSIWYVRLNCLFDSRIVSPLLYHRFVTVLCKIAIVVLLLLLCYSQKYEVSSSIIHFSITQCPDSPTSYRNVGPTAQVHITALQSGELGRDCGELRLDME